MQKVSTLRAAIAAIVVATTLLLDGCAAAQQGAATDTSTSGGATDGLAAGFERVASGGANSGGSSLAAPSLPATWPKDVPVPQSKLLGSTSSAGRWTLLLLEAGSAAQVLKSVGAFYRAAGYTAVTAALLNKGNRHVMLVVEDRDHSATKTFLAIQLTTP